MEAKKILIAALGRIGDLVLVTPVFEALKRDNPRHAVHLLAGRNNYQVISHHPHLDQVLVYRKRPWDTLKLVSRLRHARYDLWIDLKDHPSSESRLFARLGQAKVSIGYNDQRHKTFTHGVSHDVDQVGVHATARALGALEPLGIRITRGKPVLGVDPSAEARFRDFRRAHGLGPFVFVNISATDGARYWPADKWATLIKALASATPHLLLCCMQRDVPQADRLSRETPNAIRYPTGSIVDVVCAVRQAAVVITVDTSIVHICSAFDKPMVSLHANIYKEYTKYLPLSSQGRWIIAPRDGAPVSEIPVEAVMREFRALMADTRHAVPVPVRGEL